MSNVYSKIDNPMEIVRISQLMTDKIEKKEIDGVQVYQEQIIEEVERIKKNIKKEIESLGSCFLNEAVIQVMKVTELSKEVYNVSQISYKIEKGVVHLFFGDISSGLQNQGYAKINLKSGEILEHVVPKDIDKKYAINQMLSFIEGKKEINRPSDNVEAFMYEGLAVLIAVNNIAKTRQEVVKESSRRYASTGSTKKKSKGSNKQKKVKLIRTYTIQLNNNNNSEEVGEGDKREYTRHTESWTVKGFPRRLKSGKVIWIEPQTRGRGKKQGKTYQV